jgi:hypothetical protein
MTTNRPTPPSCKDVTAAADKALAEKNKALKLKDLALQDCASKNETLQVQKDQDDKKLDSIWSNPFAMILLGLVAGSAGTGIIVWKAKK